MRNTGHTITVLKIDKFLVTRHAPMHGSVNVYNKTHLPLKDTSNANIQI